MTVVDVSHISGEIVYIIDTIVSFYPGPVKIKRESNDYEIISGL